MPEKPAEISRPGCCVGRRNILSSARGWKKTSKLLCLGQAALGDGDIQCWSLRFCPQRQWHGPSFPALLPLALVSYEPHRLSHFSKCISRRLSTSSLNVFDIDEVAPTSEIAVITCVLNLHNEILPLASLSRYFSRKCCLQCPHLFLPVLSHNPILCQEGGVGSG
jgi:hypothetical protein